MVVYAEMKELVNDYHLLKGAFLSEKILTEADASAWRARSPLRRHALDLNAAGAYADL